MPFKLFIIFNTLKKLGSIKSFFYPFWPHYTTKSVKKNFLIDDEEFKLLFFMFNINCNISLQPTKSAIFFYTSWHHTHPAHSVLNNKKSQEHLANSYQTAKLDPVTKPLDTFTRSGTNHTMGRHIKLRNDPLFTKKPPGFFARLLRAILIGIGIGLIFKILLIQFIRLTH